MAFYPISSNRKPGSVFDLFIFWSRLGYVISGGWQPRKTTKNHWLMSWTALTASVKQLGSPSFNFQLSSCFTHLNAQLTEELTTEKSVKTKESRSSAFSEHVESHSLEQVSICQRCTKDFLTHQACKASSHHLFSCSSWQISYKTISDTVDSLPKQRW
jgi:hypothetical protein